MIIEDQLNRYVRRINNIEKLKKIDKFTATITILKQHIKLNSDKINNKQQTDHNMTLIYILTYENHIHNKLKQQIKSSRYDKIYNKLLIIEIINITSLNYYKKTNTKY